MYAKVTFHAAAYKIFLKKGKKRDTQQNMVEKTRNIRIYESNLFGQAIGRNTFECCCWWCFHRTLEK